MPDPIIDQYSGTASEKFIRYEGFDPAEVHRSVSPLLRRRAGTALDVGAGSGRDAHWLSQMGYEVLAIEPSALRQMAQEKYPHLHWLDDRLPGLEATRRTGRQFDLIWLSAVWMHIPPGQRQQAFESLTSLLQPGGLIMLSYRNGGTPDVHMYPVPDDELPHLAAAKGLTLLLHEQQDDIQQRMSVAWHTVLLQKTGHPTAD
jgi:SAM-dependent methyltransferase